MKLIIFNGSPRNKKSNSRLLMEQFLQGYSTSIADDVPIYYLANTTKMAEHVKAFADAQAVIIIFPLYTDSMPGLVKEFFEHIAQLNKPIRKRVGFIVQSGFPESIQSTFVEQYLIKFAARMGFEYLGTVIKGGVEGIQIMPPMMTKKLFEGFRRLGEHFAISGNFSHEVINELNKPYRLSKSNLFFFRIGIKLGLINFYWNSNLKKNNAYEKRFAKPFQ